MVWFTICKRVLSHSYLWLAILLGINLFLTTKTIGVQKAPSQSELSQDQEARFTKRLENPPASRKPLRPVSAPNLIDAQSRQHSAVANKETTTSSSPTNTYMEDIFYHLNLSNAHWDDKREFRVLHHIVKGEKFDRLSKDYVVTLASQSSLDKVQWLSQVSKTWTGPMSVTLFVPELEYQIAAKFLGHLARCDPGLMAKTSFHILFPMDHPPVLPKKNDDGTKELDMLVHNTSCSMNIAKLLDSLFKLPSITRKSYQEWRTTYAYPQNLARNIARKGANTHYTFVTDIDIVPSKGSAKGMSRFLAANQCPKCAFVVATYELDGKLSFPENKSQLLQYVKQERARPFHKTVFLQNQFATNFSMYEREQDDSVVHVSHQVTNYEFFYEPFYASLDKAPPFDERFVGYGFTRNTQVYEMHASDWQFQVLSPIFAIHWGLQKRKGRPTWRERQNNLNRKRFKTFKKEVWYRYGKTPPVDKQPPPSKKETKFSTHAAVKNLNNQKSTTRRPK